MCKAHSTVTHIKQQKIFSSPQGPWISAAFEMMKIFLLFYMCHFAMGITHCYKKAVFYFIFAVFKKYI